MPDATFHALPPTPLGASIGEAFAPVADHIEEVATGTIHSADADRYLGAVLFTDVVSSTELLASVGDAQYRQVRNSHQRQVRLAVETCGGHLMTVTGDGTMSVFEGGAVDAMHPELEDRFRCRRVVGFRSARLRHLMTFPPTTRRCHRFAHASGPQMP
ncbi:MAG: hypothetical protein ACR2FE_00170 [Aeromicrobium sp.]